MAKPTPTQKLDSYQMPVRMPGSRNSYSLLVGVWTGTAILEQFGGFLQNGIYSYYMISNHIP